MPRLLDGDGVISIPLRRFPGRSVDRSRSADQFLAPVGFLCLIFRVSLNVLKWNSNFARATPRAPARPGHESGHGYAVGRVNAYTIPRVLITSVPRARDSGSAARGSVFLLGGINRGLLEASASAVWLDGAATDVAFNER